MELSKRRYRIGEICKLLGISKSTLLGWEQNQSIPKAYRDHTLMRGRWWDEQGARAIADYRYYREKTLRH